MAISKLAIAATLAAGAFASKAKRAAAAAYEGSPFEGIQLRPDPYYLDELVNIAIPALPEELVPAAERLTEISTFQWLDNIGKIELLNSTLHEIRAENEAGAEPPYAHTIVVYNFPDRDCSASSSAGELLLEEDGLNRYKTEYIDPIVELLTEFSDVRTIIAYEPDGLANLITNMGVPKCANAASAYRESTEYALAALDLPNVAVYLDAGHAGWLGWEANLPSTAEVYAEIYTSAGSPNSTRGLVTNVSNYNGLRLDTAPDYTTPNANFDEERFHEALAPLLVAAGFPGHFIVDQGRSGVQPGGRQEWGHWCNVQDSGFGPLPDLSPDSEVLDAIVWIKPGGESDGTSDSTADRFDQMCVGPSAFTPAPEAGTWFQEYFEMLLRNAAFL
ncbi:exoglucanase-6A [Stachybotrys elegans]|uniref:Glucanase n=1 Tax=Stachybotrys elegans TaxID=80388 RepID=A0A8K0SN27_9HYPO|nr:exoglucanase-6A [Stachybotrys elegans]